MQKHNIYIMKTFFLITIMSLLSFIKPRQMENTKKQIAIDYFNAFHNGDLEKVYSYFHEEGTVQYGLEASIPHKIFFPESKELISTLKFTTYGIYESSETDSIIIHFAYEPKSGEGELIEAIDIISFNSNDQIVSVKVIPNSTK